MSIGTVVVEQLVTDLLQERQQLEEQKQRYKAELEKYIRQQAQEEIASSEEITEEQRLMILQKYGVDAPKFTKIEEKVIRKQHRKDSREVTDGA